MGTGEGVEREGRGRAKRRGSGRARGGAGAEVGVRRAMLRDGGEMGTRERRTRES
jgi:hypothetical protein